MPRLKRPPGFIECFRMYPRGRYDRAALLLMLMILVGCISACDDEPTGFGTHDQTWSATYFVDNRTSVDLFVMADGALTERHAVPKWYASGERGKLAGYVAFLGPPPNAARDFRCISVYRAADSLLVYQLGPVLNREWSRKDTGPYEAEVSLILTDDDIDLDGVEDHCGRLEGRVVRDATSAPVPNGLVIYTHSEVDHLVTQTDDQGFYHFTWSDSIPPGTVEFGGTENGRRFRIPEDVTVIRDRLYHLDVRL